MRYLLKKYIVPFSISSMVGVMINVVSIFIKRANSVIEYPIMAWIYSLDLLAFIYPIFCSVPFCWLIFHERKNNFRFFIQNRKNLKKHYSSHWICGAFLSFASLFVISISGAILSLSLNPIYHVERPSIVSDYLMGDLLVNDPLVYAFLISLLRGVIGILMFSLGYIFSMHSKYIFIVLTVPFVYSILENFCTSVFGISNFSIISSFYPESLNWDAFSVSPYISIFIGPAILTVFCLITKVYFVFRKADNDV